MNAEENPGSESEDGDLLPLMYVIIIYYPIININRVSCELAIPAISNR